MPEPFFEQPLHVLMNMLNEWMLSLTPILNIQLNQQLEAKGALKRGHYVKLLINVIYISSSGLGKFHCIKLQLNTEKEGCMSYTYIHDIHPDFQGI